MMAAMVEGIPVLDAGFTLAHNILPAAHVTVDTAALTAATPRRALRVMGAGMLHNVLLCVVCGALGVALQTVLGQGYVHTRGVVVRYVHAGMFCGC